MSEPYPNFFVVGAAKSGTTALYYLLDRHPEVFMSPIKEPNHFCTDIRPSDFSDEYRQHEKRKRFNLEKYLDGPMTEKHFDYFVTRPDQYARLFRHATHEKAIGEMSNSYLFSESAAQNIRRRVPDARIIMLLRNPVDRIFSHYLANLRDGKTRLDFRKEIDRDYNKKRKGWWISHCYYEAGLYHVQVKRYFDAFDPSRILVIRHEDFEGDAAATMRRVFSFLEVNSTLPLDYSGRFNVSVRPRNRLMMYLLSRTGLKKALFRRIPSTLGPAVKRSFFSHEPPPPMAPEDRTALLSFYLEDISRLELLTGLDLTDWKNIGKLQDV